MIISNGDIGIDGRKPKDRLCATGTNHGSIECINGQYYVFYHRQTHNTAFSRQACAEPITITPNGIIEQVEMTSCGLNGVPLTASGTYPAAICCNLTNGHMPHLSNVRRNPASPNVNHEGNLRFVKDISSGTRIGYKYFDFIGPTQLQISSRGSGGTLVVISDDIQLAEIHITPSAEWKQSAPVTFNIHGSHPLHFLYKGKGMIDLLDFSLQS